MPTVSTVSTFKTLAWQTLAGNVIKKQNMAWCVCQHRHCHGKLLATCSAEMQVCAETVNSKHLALSPSLPLLLPATAAWPALLQQGH